MKRNIAIAIALIALGRLLYSAWCRLTALRWAGPTPPHAAGPPEDVPDHAYADACHVVCATELRANEFSWENGELLWTHPIYRYFFVAVWEDNHWILRHLLTQGRKEVAVPKGIVRVVSFYGLAAEMLRSGLDPTMPARP
jgi:hypothetical protein